MSYLNYIIRGLIPDQTTGSKTLSNSSWSLTLQVALSWWEKPLMRKPIKSGLPTITVLKTPPIFHDKIIKKKSELEVLISFYWLYHAIPCIGKWWDLHSSGPWWAQEQIESHSKPLLKNEKHCFKDTLIWTYYSNW